jgi:adenylate cyclase
MSINKFLVILFSTLIVLLASLFGSLTLLSRTQEGIADSERRRYASFQLADELRQSSDDLTRMARLYVMTRNPNFSDYYQEILDIRNGVRPRPIGYDLVYWHLITSDGQRPRPYGETVSLENLMIEQEFSVSEFSKLSEAQRNSDGLVRLENIAMNAVKGRFDDGRGRFTRTGNPDFELARKLMFSEEYFLEKSAIMKPINAFLVHLNDRTKNEVSELRVRRDWLTIAALSICLITITISVASVFILRKKVIRPLALVSAATQRVSGGDYEHQVEHQSRDEVGRLVEAFNTMVDSTRNSVGKLQVANQALRDNQTELEREKRKSDELLLNILPGAIAARLKQGETSIADEFPEVTVMFVDLVGFTELADSMGPHELVKLLNEIFALFDQRLESSRLEKIKTIGDCYMVVGGIPEPIADHAQRIADFAFAIREDFAVYMASRSLDIKCRIGIHSGSAVAGVVGTKKFAYDLWGDVVNVASRMESTGVPGKIHVSEPFMVRLKDAYEFELHGDIEIKGKGEMRTYFLKGSRYHPKLVGVA